MSKHNEVRSALSAAGYGSPEIITIIDVEPDPIVGFAVDGDPIEAWEALRGLVERTGLYPVVVADEELIQEIAPEMPAPEETLRAAGELDLRRWLKRLQRESEGAEEGEWPEDAEGLDAFSVPFDVMSGERRSDMKIALLPTRAAWEAAAHLRYCAPNYDLEPHHHTALHRWWHERFGAELVTATGDVLEFRVSRPPTSREAAMEVAREQYAYCPDIVEQGVETLSTLAAMLLGGSVWYFWWD